MHYLHIRQSITILFKQWQANSITDLLFYLLLIFALSMFLECLRGFQTYFVLKLHIKGRNVPMTSKQLQSLKRRRFMKHIIATIIYMAQLTCAYLVMLIIMTYDSRILLAIMAGVLLGYYLADPLIVQGMESIYLKNVERGRARERAPTQSSGRLLEQETFDIEDRI